MLSVVILHIFRKSLFLLDKYGVTFGPLAQLKSSYRSVVHASCGLEYAQGQRREQAKKPVAIKCTEKLLRSPFVIRQIHHVGFSYPLWI